MNSQKYTIVSISRFNCCILFFIEKHLPVLYNLDSRPMEIGYIYVTAKVFLFVYCLLETHRILVNMICARYSIGRYSGK